MNGLTIVGLVSLASGGVYGYKKGKDVIVADATKKALIYGPLVLATAASFYYYDEYIGQLFHGLRQTNQHEAADIVYNLHYEHRVLSYMMTGAFNLLGTSINLGLGYLAGKFIGRKFGKKVENGLESIIANKGNISDDKLIQQLKKRLVNREINIQEYNELVKTIKR